MLALVLGAIRRRWAQAALLLVLGALAATGAAAAPWYIVATNEQLAAAGAEQATAEQQLVRSAIAMPVGMNAASAVSSTVGRIESAMKLPGYQRYHDVRVDGFVGAEQITLAARDNLCAEVAIQGACDVGNASIVIDDSTAVRLHVKPGDQVPFALTGITSPIVLTISGIYAPRDPGDVYWTPLRDGSVPIAYTGLATLVDPRLQTTPMTVTVDQVLTPQAFRQTDPQQLAAAYEAGNALLVPSSVRSQSKIRALANQVTREQQMVLTGVGVGACHLLVLSWLALYLAIAQTARTRRPDVALVKMRGGRRRDLWLLVTGQSVVPILIGSAWGVGLGGLLARLLAGPVEGDAMRQQVVYATAITVGVAILGAVVAALVAEQRMLTEPVTELSRDVPRRRRTWIARAVDAVVVLVALVSAYEVTAGSLGRSAPRGVGLVAPIVIALAVGVLLARLVPLTASAIAVPCLRAGHLTVGLTTVHIARRRGMAGVVAMTVLAISVLCGAAVAWDTSNRARSDRATADVGADRVLLVDASSRGKLLDAVAKADPSGRYAMAAFEIGGTQPVLAVDTTRLAAVAVPAPYFAGTWAEMATKLRPVEPASAVHVTGTSLTLDASWTKVALIDQQPAGGDDAAANSPAAVNSPGVNSPGVNSPGGKADAHNTAGSKRPVTRAYVDLLTDDGAASRVLLGPLTDGRHSYQADTSACKTGCRLVDIGVKSDLEAPVPPAGSRLIVHGMAQHQPDRTVLGPADLTDRTRWRASVLPDNQLPRIDRAPDGLSITTDSKTVARGFPYLDAAAYRLDAPTPLPVLLWGSLEAQRTIGDTRVGAFGYQLPVRVVATSTALPRLTEKGVLMDLGYVDRVLSDGRTSGTAEVWLTADAPPSIEESLTQSGIRVVSRESRVQRLRLLESQWPTIVLRFLLLAAVAGAVLAIATFVVVASVERAAQARELGALRQQGLAEQVVRGVGTMGYVVICLSATVVAIGAAASLRPMFAEVFPIFSDGWAVLSPPPWRGSALWRPAVAVALAQLIFALFAGRQLVRAVRRLNETTPPDPATPTRREGKRSGR